MGKQKARVCKIKNKTGEKRKRFSQVSASVPLKPFSANKMYTGRKRKSIYYKQFIREVLTSLEDDARSVPRSGMLRVCFVFNVENIAADVDNMVKPMLDILQTKYGFNDRQVFSLVVDKYLVDADEVGIYYEIKKYNGVYDKRTKKRKKGNKAKEVEEVAEETSTEASILLFEINKLKDSLLDTES